MTLFQAFVLGSVQGLSEFLPISSSAHLILVPWLFGWKDPGIAFDAVLHLGTLLAVFIYFIQDWFLIVKGGILSIIDRRIGFDPHRLLFWLITVGTIPAGIAGLLLHDYAETAFRSVLLIAITLATVGFLLYWIDGSFPSAKEIEHLGMKDALWIGVAQAFAIVPGVSRSGATMAMARLLGVSRESSARFSFLLSFPIILAAGLFEWKNLSLSESTISVGALITGLTFSFLTGILAIHTLLRFLRRADFAIFAWYRIGIAGLIVILTAMFGL